MWTWLRARLGRSRAFCRNCDSPLVEGNVRGFCNGECADEYTIDMTI